MQRQRRGNFASSTSASRRRSSRHGGPASPARHATTTTTITAAAAAAQGSSGVPAPALTTTTAAAAALTPPPIPARSAARSLAPATAPNPGPSSRPSSSSSPGPSSRPSSSLRPSSRPGPSSDTRPAPSPSAVGAAPIVAPTHYTSHAEPAPRTDLPHQSQPPPQRTTLLRQTAVPFVASALAMAAANFCALAFQPTPEQREGREGRWTTGHTMIHVSSLGCLSVVLVSAPAIIDAANEWKETPEVWRAVRT
ncbi:hypothetical protein HRG_002184 [Hirsutella rhossiliensis]|uniref:Uncharacterized protein n=1 Tax=Hirsutella rhossiliensis TaxID=111463 RepID=A0A9P8N4M7_9HYPO|nr:uncharacterized protein HRG_02184 [Hirsutella rhossiliensis]KAH0966775.1 hypothetical protein HRG_02184 [Hirsutella rhossiliensis]